MSPNATQVPGKIPSGIYVGPGSGGTGIPIPNVYTVTANHTAAAWDYVIDNAGVIVTMPVTPTAGQEVTVETTENAFATLIKPGAGATIDGLTEITNASAINDVWSPGFPKKVTLIAVSSTLWTVLSTFGDDYDYGEANGGQLQLVGGLSTDENDQGSTSYAALVTDLYISFTSGSPTLTLTNLPTGQPQLLIVSNQGSGVVTLTPHGSDTVDSPTVPPHTTVWLYGSDFQGANPHHKWFTIGSPNAAVGVHVVAVGGAAQTLPAIGSAAGSDITLSADLTVTMPTAARGAVIYATLRQAASGGPFTAVFTGVLWPGGTAPTMSTGASAIDIYSFTSDGTSWYGTVVGQAFA